MTTHLQLTPGTLVGGDFRVVRALGAGGMGTVYVALQESTGKERALKVMHSPLGADDRLRARFEREARVGAMIDSDHVVEVIGAGVEPGSGLMWIAMELLEGDDLGRHVVATGCLSATELGGLLRQLCHALGAAHRVGVVHRDVKPENIFVARTRTSTAPTTIKMLDFGIARVAAQAQTTATATLGSPAWMAPEQTDPKAPITPATDVWALGLLCFWLLVGRPYWRAAADPDASIHALMRDILFSPLEPASARAAEHGAAERLPPGFDEWFGRAVARDPEERFATADELLEAYEALLDRPSNPADDLSVLAEGASLPPDEIGEPRYSSTSTPTTSDAAPAFGVPTSAAGPWRMRVALAAGLLLALAVASLGPDPLVVRARLAARATLLYDDVAQHFVRSPAPTSAPSRTHAASASIRHAVAYRWRPGPAPHAAGHSSPASPSSSAPGTSSSRTPGSAAPIGAAPSTSASSAFASPPPATMPAFDFALAQRRMQTQAGAASAACRALAAAAATIGITVTFTQSGAPSRVDVNGGGKGASATAFCVQKLFWAVRVPPFSGPPTQQVSALVHLR